MRKHKGKAAEQDAEPVAETEPPVTDDAAETEPPVTDDAAETEPESAPMIDAWCLIDTLPFYEGGHRLHTYPAGFPVMQMSQDAKDWLTRNSTTERPFVEIREIEDPIGPQRERQIEEAEAEVVAAQLRAVEAAQAFVAASTPEEAEAAQVANNAASSALATAEKRLETLTDG